MSDKRADHNDNRIDRVLVAARDVEGLAIAARIEAGGRETVLLMRAADEARGWVEQIPYVVYIPDGEQGRWPDEARVVHAAMDAGCDAVHPASGRLAHSADFASLFERLNTALIGPGPDMLARVPAALDGGLSLEEASQSMPRARWIEVPVLGDGAGAALALGDRELHLAGGAWVVLVESPAPELGTGLRGSLHEQAVLLAARLRTPGPATARFAVLPDGGARIISFYPGIEAWFSATDAALGLDIVDAQIRMSEGEALGWSTDSIAIQRTAIWMLISALGPGSSPVPEDEPDEDDEEDAAEAPSGVRVGDVRLPQAAICAVHEGDRCIAGDGLASVTVTGRTRNAAIVLARAALDDIEVEGVLTTVDGLNALLGDADFWRAASAGPTGASSGGH